jgi:hypothetical protein
LAANQESIDFAQCLRWADWPELLDWLAARNWGIIPKTSSRHCGRSCAAVSYLAGGDGGIASDSAKGLKFLP